VGHESLRGGPCPGRYAPDVPNRGGGVQRGGGRVVGRGWI
jgi:hypothetical protein